MPSPPSSPIEAWSFVARCSKWVGPAGHSSCVGLNHRTCHSFAFDGLRSLRGRGGRAACTPFAQKEKAYAQVANHERSQAPEIVCFRQGTRIAACLCGVLNQTEHDHAARLATQSGAVV